MLIVDQKVEVMKKVFAQDASYARPFGPKKRILHAYDGDVLDGQVADHDLSGCRPPNGRSSGEGVDRARALDRKLELVNEVCIDDRDRCSGVPHEIVRACTIHLYSNDGARIVIGLMATVAIRGPCANACHGFENRTIAR